MSIFSAFFQPSSISSYTEKDPGSVSLYSRVFLYNRDSPEQKGLGYSNLKHAPTDSEQFWAHIVMDLLKALRHNGRQVADCLGSGYIVPQHDDATVL
jgi:hypothetical protein